MGKTDMDEETRVKLKAEKKERKRQEKKARADSEQSEKEREGKVRDRKEEKKKNKQKDKKRDKDKEKDKEKDKGKKDKKDKKDKRDKKKEKKEKKEKEKTRDSREKAKGGKVRQEHETDSDMVVDSSGSEMVTGKRKRDTESEPGESAKFSRTDPSPGSCAGAEKRKRLWGGSRGGAAPAKEKRKLLWSNKEKNTNRWEASQFGNDNTKRKFLKLMGVKDPDAVLKEKGGDDAMRPDVIRKRFSDLEKGFQDGLKANKSRGKGLGSK